MKRIKHYFGIILIITLILTACPPEVIFVKGVSLDKNSETIALGDSFQLHTIVSPPDATNTKVSWHSDDDSIAAVNSTGLVTGAAVGTTTITVTTEDGDLTDNCTVTVYYIPVQGATLNKNNTEIPHGLTEQLFAVISPPDATNQAVTWDSDDENIADVDSQGVVTAVDVGTATITMTTMDGNYTDTCSVTVTPVAVTGISFNSPTTQILLGYREYFSGGYTIFPENATNQDVTWSVNDTSIILVYSDGQVYARALGPATLTVTTVDGGFTDTCEITVVPVDVTGFTIHYNTTNLAVGDTKQIGYSIFPPNATNQNCTWESSYDSIVTVDNDGMATAMQTGDATVSVTTGDGGFTDSIEVSVYADEAIFYIEQDSYVIGYQDYLDTNHGNLTTCRIGKFYRTYLDFDVTDLDSLLDIQSAYLWIYLSSQSGWVLPDDFRIHIVSGSWDESTITWNNQPIYNAASIIIDPVQFQDQTGQWCRLDITDIVNDWKGGTTDYGIVIESDDNYGYMSFYSREETEVPYLQVIY